MQEIPDKQKLNIRKFGYTRMKNIGQALIHGKTFFEYTKGLMISVPTVFTTLGRPMNVANCNDPLLQGSLGS